MKVDVWSKSGVRLCKIYCMSQRKTCRMSKSRMNVLKATVNVRSDETLSRISRSYFTSKLKVRHNENYPCFGTIGILCPMKNALRCIVFFLHNDIMLLFYWIYADLNKKCFIQCFIFLYDTVEWRWNYSYRICETTKEPKWLHSKCLGHVAAVRTYFLM